MATSLVPAPHLVRCIRLLMAALLLSGLEAFSPGLQAPAVQTRSAAPAMVIGQQAESFGVRAGDLIASLKGRMLSPDTTRDDFFEELVSSERPVAIGLVARISSFPF